jgi:hypothetical protein
MDHVSELVADQEHQPSPQEIEAAGQVPFDFGGAHLAPAPGVSPADFLAQSAKNAEALVETGEYTVAGDAAEGPVRQPFGEWLLTQKDRKGWVGDLAKAAKADPGFPKRGDPDDVRKRLKDLGASGDVYEALDDAELDWLAL